MMLKQWQTKIGFLTAALLSVLLSGCSLFSAATVDLPTTYQLKMAPNNAIKMHQTGLTLLVSVPTNGPGYETRQMVYVDKPYEFSYFTRNEWISPPASMIATLAAQSLESTGAYKAVVQAPYAGFSDVRLDINLVDLYQNFLVKPSQEHVTLQAELLNVHNHRVLASKRFSAVVTAATDSPLGGVFAANQALKQIIPRMTVWAVKHSHGVKPGQVNVNTQLSELPTERYG